MLCPFGYDNTFSSSICISLFLGFGMLVSFGVSFYVRGTRKVGNKKNGSSDIHLNLNSFIPNPSRRHVLVLKILGGLTVLGVCGLRVGATIEFFWTF